jgi:hypothetical protein
VLVDASTSSRRSAGSRVRPVVAPSVFTHYLARVDGVPASVARRAAFEATYPSPIGCGLGARSRSRQLRDPTAVATHRRREPLDVPAFADVPTAIGIYRARGL